MRKILPAVLFLLIANALCAAPARPSPLDGAAPYRRCLWVTRWNYKTPEDIERICYNAASARFTDLLFQVRGEGTVFFKSQTEPWSWQLSGLGVARGLGKDPGWDPLAVALREGRRRGLRVHAWMNAMPGWSQKAPPPPGSGQLMAEHKSWFMMNASGQPVCPEGFYAFLDPALPEVREHLGRLVEEMVHDYDLDGVHLDYIRYPLLEESVVDVSFNPAARRLFAQKYRGFPEDAPEKWKEFRRESVSATIRRIRQSIKEARPGVELSATTMADQGNRENGTFQDPVGWIQSGIVDAVVPMVYVRGDMDRFEVLTEPFFSPSQRDHVWVGIWPRKLNPNYLEQVKMVAEVKPAGLAVFSYDDLFPRHKAAGSAVNLYRAFVNAPGAFSPESGRLVAQAGAEIETPPPASPRGILPHGVNPAKAAPPKKSPPAKPAAKKTALSKKTPASKPMPAAAGAGKKPAASTKGGGKSPEGQKKKANSQ